MNGLQRPRQLLSVLAWNAAITFLLLLTIEIYLRYRVPSVYVRTSPGRHATKVAIWVEPDPELGWTVTRRPEWGILERVPYRINRQGFRHGEDFDSMPRKTSERHRVLVLGDSFTFGVHLQDNETLPAFLGQRLGPKWEVINLGVPGYGIDQMVLSYEKHHDSLQPDTVVLVFIDEDIDRVFEAFRTLDGLAKPSFDLEGGELVARKASERTILDSLLHRSRIANVIYSRWYRPRESMRIADAFLRRLAALVSSHREKLVVVRYPRLEQLDGQAVYPPLPFHQNPCLARCYLCGAI